MGWTKLPAVEHAGHNSNCLTCGPNPREFPLDGVIAVGFGWAGVTKDGETVIHDATDLDAEDVTGAHAEAAAVNDPDHDWRIVLEGPLKSAEYQRHEAGKWVLVETGEGFA